MFVLGFKGERGEKNLITPEILNKRIFCSMRGEKVDVLLSSPTQLFLPFFPLVFIPLLIFAVKKRKLRVT